MEKVVLNVEGMSCAHCENAIKKAVGSLDGVSEVVVDLENKIVTVQYNHEKVTVEKIKSEIEEQGYDVI